MAESLVVSNQRQDGRDPIIRVSIPEQFHALDDDDDDDDVDYSLYSDRNSYLDLSEEMALSSIYNELEISRIYKSFGVMCGDDQNYFNNACGTKPLKKMVSCGTQTKHETGHAPVPWIIEVKDKIDCLYIELSNIINTLLHTPRQSLYEKSPSKTRKFLSPVQKQEVSENKNMTYWFQENGVWKSLLHPGIKIPCSVASKEVCAIKQTPSKTFEEKMKNLLKTVVEMKNLIPIVADNIENKPPPVDNLPNTLPNVSASTKLSHGIQTEKLNVDVGTSTFISMDEIERLEASPSNRAPSSNMAINGQWRETSTKTELESFVKDLPACEPKTDINTDIEHSKSHLPMNELLSPICELFGVGNGIDIGENPEITDGAGESLYTFTPKPANGGIEYPSEMTIAKEMTINREDGLENNGSLFVSANEMTKGTSKIKGKVRSNSRYFKDPPLPEGSLKSHNKNTRSDLCLPNISRNQVPGKIATSELANANKTVRERHPPPVSKVQVRHSLCESSTSDKGKRAEGVRPKTVYKDKFAKPSVHRSIGFTFGKRNSSQNSSKSAQRRNAQDLDLGTVPRSTSTNKVVNPQSVPKPSISTRNHQLIGKTLKGRPETVSRLETGILVTNCAMALTSIAGPSKEKPQSRKGDPAVARNPKPVTARKSLAKIRVSER